MLARWYPGLPDLEDMSPVDIAAYWTFMSESLKRKPGEEE
jgi:hypothetical protein